jgi:tetratricopeptide (TPR) repeat protein
MEDGKFNDALNDFNVAMKNQHDKDEINYHIALVHYRNNEYDNAIKYLDKAKNYKGGMNINELRGNMNYLAKNYEEAIKDYSKAQLQLPNRMEILKNRANCFYNIKKYENAIEDYSVVLQNMQDATILHNRANSYRALERYENAIEDCKQFIQLAKTNEELEIFIPDVEKEIEFMKHKLSENKK